MNVKKFVSVAVLAWLIIASMACLVPQFEIPTAKANDTGNIFEISVDSTNHNNYGLGYPVTYVFNISESVTSAKCYYKFTDSGNWSELTSKASNDFFNGINTVRFNYTTHQAYASIGFSEDSDEIYLKFVDTAENPIACSFISIPVYYDNRKCVVALTADDMRTDYPFIDICQARSIWVSLGFWTNSIRPQSWADLQTQLNQGFVEADSHSRSHPHVPYANYDSEIGGSKQDVISNLSLPSPYKKGSTEYVYGWIDPYAERDETVRTKLGQYKYLCERGQGVIGEFPLWDNVHGLYNICEYSIKMGTDGSTNVNTLNAAFDNAYNNGKIYLLTFHPNSVKWTEGEYATQHLDHIKDKKDVWYAGWGASYSYHYVQERGIVQVEVVEQEVPNPNQVELNHRKENHTSYIDISIESPSSGFNVSDWGTPVTIGNNISVNAKIWRWTGADPPVVITISHTYNLGNLPAGEYLFTFKVWGFSIKNITFTIPITVPDDYPTIQEAINHANEGDTIFVRNGTYYENVVVNKTISLIGEDRTTTIIDGNGTGTVVAVYADFAMVRGFSIQHSGFFLGLPSGIEVGSSNCTIIGNTIVLNKGGISLLFGGNHTISNNIISSSYYGINIIYSENNKIFHNSFLNNTQHVYITGSINNWDNGYPSGGNYWSDYAGADSYSGPYQNETGSDGIGDIPYTIDASNRDNYPLMTPYPCIHAVAIKNIRQSKTVIGQSFTTNLYVDIANQGHFPETFNVTVYANTTIISQTEVTLTSGNSTTITFVWNTTGFAKGNYTIWAYVSPVSNETDTADNTLPDGWVIVAMVGDITGPDGWPDGKVDMIYDIRSVAKLFGVVYPDPRYIANYDINGDLKIDMINDIRTVAKHFGDIYP